MSENNYGIYGELAIFIATIYNFIKLMVSEEKFYWHCFCLLICIIIDIIILINWRKDPPVINTNNEYFYNPQSIQCPYCNSKNIKKISTTKRVVSIGIVGLASDKIGKQWHCKNCKSNF